MNQIDQGAPAHTAEQIIQRRLVRQLKILNTILLIVGSSVVISLVVLAVLIFQVISAVASVSSRIEATRTSISESVDVREQICGDNDFLNQLQICQR